MKKNIKLLLLAIPFYPIALIGEWHECRTRYSNKKFSLKDAHREYKKTIHRFFMMK